MLSAASEELNAIFKGDLVGPIVAMEPVVVSTVELVDPMFEVSTGCAVTKLPGDKFVYKGVVVSVS